METVTYTAAHAKRELDILIKTVSEPIVGPFRDELIALCEKFGQSGQSGGSAPFTAAALGHAVKNLCMQKPICDITGIDEEWNNISEMNEGKKLYQNNRYSAIFKEENGRAYYIDAIVFKDQNGHTFTCNGVKLPDGGVIKSRQYIKEFPFRPKTFYIDVISTETKKDWWESTIRDTKQLKAVYKYYAK